MHDSSYLKMRVFLETYSSQLPESPGRIRVLEVGSKSYEGQGTYRPLFGERFEYVGLDLEQGEGVDVVPRSAFVWPEIPSSSFGLCVSGQTFEHNPYPWVTFCEMARVLQPGGMGVIIAPAAGRFHRYPLDCWRYYPDSWAALCHVARVELVETLLEPADLAARVPGGQWRDSIAIFRKSETPTEELAQYYQTITEPFANATAPTPPEIATGPFSDAYRARARTEFPARPLKALRRRMGGKSIRILD